MITRLRFSLLYFVYWMAYYAVARLVFLAYHHAEAARAGLGLMAGSVTHGTRMDLAAAAAPCLIVFPLVAISVALPRLATRIILALTLLFVTVVSLFVAGDAELFRNWGFRLDGAVLQYLNTPGEMVSASKASPVLLVLAIFVVLAVLASLAFVRLFGPALRAWTRTTIPAGAATIAASAVLIAALYVPLHGGIQKNPIKQSTVFFSSDAFANQAALNVTWNFLDGIWHRTYVKTNPYQYFAPAEAERIADSLLAPGSAPPRRLLRLARPNVILILWESLTSKVVARLGGIPGITPNLDSLMHDGILFDHFYATGYRSPRGLVGVLSGYPSQPTTEIILQPRKSASLPALPHDFHAAGYRSRFYYGGDPAFANFRSYLLAAGFDTLITGDAFAGGVHRTIWGQDDPVVLGRMLADVPTMPRPFFTALFTMSSHEPFDVPIAPIIPGSDEGSRFENAHAYTDRSIGDFIRVARRQPWWDSTLIVIVADHGHRLPVVDPQQSQRQWEIFTIPMVWLGGALAVRDTVITQLGGQTDIPATLLAQLGLDVSRYHFSRDLLAPGTLPWAWFSFKDGFGFVNAQGGKVAWDNIGRRVMAATGPTGTGDIRAGEAVLQRLIDDYVSR